MWKRTFERFKELKKAMVLRFQRSIRLGKFLRLNLSKSGLGASVGVKGLRIGTGPRGRSVSAGIPGTGLSARSYLGKGGEPSRGDSAPARIGSLGVLIMVVILAAAIGLGLMLLAAWPKG